MGEKEAPQADVGSVADHITQINVQSTLSRRGRRAREQERVAKLPREAREARAAIRPRPTGQPSGTAARPTGQPSGKAARPEEAKGNGVSMVCGILNSKLQRATAMRSRSAASPSSIWMSFHITRS